MTMMNDLIRRQDAVDALLEEANKDGAHGYLDAMEAESIIKSVPSAQKWTPTTEGLPKVGESCWVTYEGEVYEGVNLTENGHWRLIRGILTLASGEQPTAWMYRYTPEPYKEEA